MKTFNENLSALPTCEHLTTLLLLDAQGNVQAVIENKPGSQGSFRVYHFVVGKWGCLGPEAAREALALFAEHAEDARIHLGKHPNIDRLFKVLSQNQYYEARFS